MCINNLVDTLKAIVNFLYEKQKIWLNLKLHNVIQCFNYEGRIKHEHPWL